MGKQKSTAGKYTPFAFALSLGSLLVKVAASVKKSEEIVDGIFWVFAVVAILSVIVFLSDRLASVRRQRRKVTVNIDTGSVSQSKVLGVQTKDADAEVRLRSKCLRNSDLTGFRDSE